MDFDVLMDFYGLNLIRIEKEMVFCLSQRL